MEDSAFLNFDCPQCHEPLSLPEEFAGVEGPCPFCEAEIRAPSSQNSSDAVLLALPSEESADQTHPGKEEAPEDDSEELMVRTDAAEEEFLTDAPEADLFDDTPNRPPDSLSGPVEDEDPEMEKSGDQQNPVAASVDLAAGTPADRWQRTYQENLQRLTAAREAETQNKLPALERQSARYVRLVLTLCALAALFYACWLAKENGWFDRYLKPSPQPAPQGPPPTIGRPPADVEQAVENAAKQQQSPAQPTEAPAKETRPLQPLRLVPLPGIQNR